MNTLTTTARHIGYCPCCAKDFKVRDGLLVHHGYERPGCGYIIGDCIGVGYQPHETSPDLAKRYVDLLTKHKERAEESLAKLPSATKLTHKGYRETKILVKGECPEYEWRSAYKSVEWNLKSELVSLNREIKRVQGLIDTWEPKPLTTVMEEKAAKRAAKAEREAAAKAKKASKVADYIERCQKRIDTATRRKNPRTLSSIFEGAPDKLRDLHWTKAGTISRADALKMLDRDNVWKAFGLLTDEGYLNYDKAPGCDILRKMSWDEDYPWPEGL